MTLHIFMAVLIVIIHRTLFGTIRVVVRALFVGFMRSTTSWSDGSSASLLGFMAVIGMLVAVVHMIMVVVVVVPVTLRADVINTVIMFVAPHVLVGMVFVVPVTAIIFL